MLDSQRTFKIRVTSRWKVRKFAYASSYLHLKSFAWKKDCPIYSSLQTSESLPRPFQKALIELYKSLPASFPA